MLRGTAAGGEQRDQPRAAREPGARRERSSARASQPKRPVRTLSAFCLAGRQRDDGWLRSPHPCDSRHSPRGPGAAVLPGLGGRRSRSRSPPAEAAGRRPAPRLARPTTTARAANPLAVNLAYRRLFSLPAAVQDPASAALPGGRFALLGGIDAADTSTANVTVADLRGPQRSAACPTRSTMPRPRCSPAPCTCSAAASSPSTTTSSASTPRPVR